MKNLIRLPFSLILIVQLSSLSGQCKSFNRKVDLSLLKHFDFCEGLKAAMMYPEESAEVTLKVNAKTKYRILFEHQDYLGDVQLSIIDREGKEKARALNANEQDYWEVHSMEKEKLTLKIQFEKRDRPDHHIKAAGCVVLAIGQLSFDPLVSKD